MKNEFKVTKQELMSLARQRGLSATLNIVLLCLWSLIALMGFFLIVLYSLFGGDWTDWVIVIVWLTRAIYKLFFSRFVFYASRYKMLSKTYGVSEWIRTTEFIDEEIILTDHTAITRLKYENIKKIKENDHVAMIFMNTPLSFRIYKNAFVEGSWEECKKKINSMRK